jgi:hypothetical protein
MEWIQLKLKLNKGEDLHQKILQLIKKGLWEVLEEVVSLELNQRRLELREMKSVNFVIRMTRDLLTMKL